MLYFLPRLCSFARTGHRSREEIKTAELRRVATLLMYVTRRVGGAGVAHGRIHRDVRDSAPGA